MPGKVRIVIPLYEGVTQLDFTGPSNSSRACRIPRS
jgi:hypothetical protein